MPQSITQLLKMLSRLRQKYHEHPLVAVDRFILQAKIFANAVIAFHQHRGNEKTLYREAARMIVETMNLIVETMNLTAESEHTALEKTLSAVTREFKASLELGAEPEHHITPSDKETEYAPRTK